MAVDLSRQKKLDEDLKGIELIEFIGQLTKNRKQKAEIMSQRTIC